MTATETAEAASIRVADDGPGVPDSDRERVFEPGVSDGASGYGLYVARTIVEQFDGTIAVEDSELGGAAFVVRLPSRPPDPNSQEHPTRSDRS